MKGKRKKKNMWASGLSPSRIEALCDGVFAIAMTILVLELSVDEHILKAIAFAEGGNLYYLLDGIYTYVMGFVVLGVYWVLHHYMFNFIKRSDGVLVWLNVLFLMFAALVPLSTKVSRTYPDSYPGYFFYVTSMVIAILLLLVIWQYATRGYRLVDRDIGGENISVVNGIIIISVSVILAVLVGAYFLPWFGWLGFIPLGYVIAATACGHHNPFSKRQAKTK